MREEPFLRVCARARHDHDGEQHRRGDRRRQAERQQQARSRFSDTRRQCGAPAGNEAQLLEEAPRTCQSVTPEPAEQLLGAVRGQRQPHRQAQNQDSDTHGSPRSFLVEWNYLTGSIVAMLLPDVKGLSFGKLLGTLWYGETRGFAVQHVPARDCGAGTTLERIDPERAPGGTAALQRALATRQGTRGQSPIVTA